MAIEVISAGALLSSPAALAAAGWAAASVALGLISDLRRRRSALVTTGLLLLGALAAALAVEPAVWIRPALGPLGLSTASQWLLAGALVLSSLPGKRAPRCWSFVPLALVSWQGLGAMVAAFALAGTGALEPGQPRRLVLLGGMGLLSLALWIDTNSLWLWGQAGARLGLGMDPASWLVDASEVVARWAGFGGLLRWSARPA